MGAQGHEDDARGREEMPSATRKAYMPSERGGMPSLIPNRYRWFFCWIVILFIFFYFYLYKLLLLACWSCSN